MFSVWTRLNSIHQKSVQLVSSWCILWVSKLFFFTCTLFIVFCFSFSADNELQNVCNSNVLVCVCFQCCVSKKDLLSESNEDTRHCLNAVHPDCSAHRGNCFVMIRDCKLVLSLRISPQLSVAKAESLVADSAGNYYAI